MRLGSNTFVLGFFGSFYHYEGLELLVRAMVDLVPAYPEIVLLLLGSGPEESSLRGLVDTLGLTGNIVFAGKVPHDEISRYYSIVDLFVYPRLPIRLNELVTPLKPLEAMASAKLVLASNVGGHRELIRAEETGLLHEAGSVKDLTRVMARVLENTQAFDSIRHRGREFVLAERTWEKLGTLYQGVYESALNGR